jgi:hypothetical protein
MRVKRRLINEMDMWRRGKKADKEIILRLMRASE